MSRPPAWRPPDPLPLPLETRRTVIDVYRDADAGSLFDAVDASRAGLLPWLPWVGTDHHDEAESLDRIRVLAKQRGHAHPEAYHLGVFDRAAPREVLGGIGFVRIEADDGLAEIGFWIRTDRQGEGLATEATGRLITSGFEGWGFRRIVIGSDAANAASIRVAEKLGLRRETHEVASRWRVGRGWRDHVGFAVLRGEWNATRGQALSCTSGENGSESGRA